MNTLTRTKTKPAEGSKQQVGIKVLAESSGRSFQADEVRAALVEELEIVRARFNREVPDNVAVKLFVIDALQGILSSKNKALQSHLIMILQDIKEDYEAFTLEKCEGFKEE